jgi:Protein of unknown function (DUF1761)
MKFFAGLTTWALPLAATASFLFGGLWYGLLSKQWLAAAEIHQHEIDAKGTRGMVAALVITFLAELFMAWMLAGVLLHLAKGGTGMGWRGGMITAAFLWAGFVMTTLIVNHRYQMARPTLTLIDGGHWLGVLLIQGAILGAFGLAAH